MSNGVLTVSFSKTSIFSVRQQAKISENLWEECCRETWRQTWEVGLVVEGNGKGQWSQ